MYQSKYFISSTLSESLKPETWYERLNLFGKLKRFCQYCTGTFIFWLAVGITTLAEPVLCSRKPDPQAIFMQVILLGISSALYVIQLIGVASREWDKIVMIQALSMSSTSLIIPVTNFTPLKLFIFFTAEGEYILEFCCLFGGWMTIFVYPGLAVLRCFRVFRLLWFYEVEIFKSTTEYGLNPILGAKFVSRLFKVLKFAIKSLSALGNEMFRLTNATRGGMLLMMVFFYSAFVLGTSLWIETGGVNEACSSYQQCTYTLMRLTFYDGTGFDFAYSLTTSHRFLFFLTMIYMCLTSFGIMNGLVGIFGTAFAAASDDAFHDTDDEEDEEEEEEEQEQADLDNDRRGRGRMGRKTADGGYDDLENDGDDDDDLDNNAVENFTSFRDLMKSMNGGGRGSSRRFSGQDTGDGNDGDGEVEAPPGMFMSREPSRKRLEAKQIQSKLKGALGGKSHFALKELTKLADAEVKAAKPRRTLKDVVKQNSIGKGVEGKPNSVHPMFAALKAVKEKNAPTAAVAETEGIPGPPISSPEMEQRIRAMLSPATATHKKPAKNLHAAVGMFAHMKQQKSGKNLLGHHGSAAAGGSAGGAASHGSNAAGGAGGPFGEYLAGSRTGAAGALPAATTAELKSMNASIHTLQRIVETQNEMMMGLFQQIQALNKNLHIIHPGLPAEPSPVPPASVASSTYGKDSVDSTDGFAPRKHGNFMAGFHFSHNKQAPAAPAFSASTEAPNKDHTGSAFSPNSSTSSLPKSSILSAFGMSLHRQKESAEAGAVSPASSVGTLGTAVVVAAQSPAADIAPTAASTTQAAAGAPLAQPAAVVVSNSSPSETIKAPVSVLVEHDSQLIRAEGEEKKVTPTLAVSFNVVQKNKNNDNNNSNNNNNNSSNNNNNNNSNSNNNAECGFGHAGPAAVHPVPQSSESNLCEVHPDTADSSSGQTQQPQQQQQKQQHWENSSLDNSQQSDRENNQHYPMRSMGLDGGGSLDSFGSIDVIDASENSSISRPTPFGGQYSPYHTSAAAGGGGGNNRPVSQSGKPRKSPVPSLRHHGSRGGQSVLEAMGRITTPKEELKFDLRFNATDGSRESPDTIPFRPDYRSVAPGGSSGDLSGKSQPRSSMGSLQKTANNVEVLAVAEGADEINPDTVTRFNGAEV